MEMSGEVKIPAPRDRVWAALNDPVVLKAAIPGCSELTRVSDTEMSATVTAKVGIIKAAFKGSVTLSNVRAPEGYTIAGEGKGGVAGFAGAAMGLSRATGWDVGASLWLAGVVLFLIVAPGGVELLGIVEPLTQLFLLVT